MSDLNLIKREGSSCSELLECFYDLSLNECEAFYQIAARESVSLDELAATIKRDRSTTHRLLQKLVNLGLCYKEKISLPKGGYSHRYRAASISRVRDQLQTRINDYLSNLEDLFGRVESEMNEKIEKFRMED